MKYYGQIVGCDGKQEWKRVAYILADKIFSRNVLTNYTWTGMSKMKNKFPFCQFNRLRAFLFTIVNRASDLSCEEEFELFIKNCILKHSETRAGNDSRTSTPRTSTQRTAKKGENSSENSENVSDV